MRRALTAIALGLLPAWAAAQAPAGVAAGWLQAEPASMARISVGSACLAIMRVFPERHWGKSPV
mgnify:CR=1 FL=1